MHSAVQATATSAISAAAIETTTTTAAEPLLSVRDLRRLAVVVFLAGAALLAVTPWFGTEIKGATRWISLAGLSIQPSEFVKPAFAVVAAWRWLLCYELWHESGEWPLPEAK